MATSSASTLPAGGTVSVRRTILTVSTKDVAGGAERAARELHREYVARGEDAWLGVGAVGDPDARTRLIPNRARRSLWARSCMAIADALPQRRAGLKVARLLGGVVAEPGRWWRARRGDEDFDHPGSADLLAITPTPPQVLHLHNLHGGYFDLRALPALTARIPTIITLHDAWLFSGHCAHSLSCERWETGCGSCPALWTYPAVPRDRTAANWERKRALYDRSRLYVASPSTWLAERAKRSILSRAMRDLRVIPPGIDLTTFKPADRANARVALGLDPARPVALTFAAALQSHTWRDAESFRGAMAQLTGEAPRRSGSRWARRGRRPRSAPCRSNGDRPNTTMRGWRSGIRPPTSTCTPRAPTPFHSW